MKVTVITVCFNSERTIADTLTSVARQSHGDIEHILIDGASTDDTLAVARRFGTRLSCVVSEPDGGIYDAMNKGLRKATGHLIGFLNADDAFFSSESVAALARAAAQEPSADAVYGDLVYVRSQGKVLRHWRSGPFSRSRLRFGWMPPHPTFYVTSDTLMRVGLLNDGLKIAADYDFILRCLTKPGARAAYVPQVLVRMRTGGASNRSLAAMISKSREDLWALRNNDVGGWPSLLCKNLRKLPQFLPRGLKPRRDV